MTRRLARMMSAAAGVGALVVVTACASGSGSGTASGTGTGAGSASTSATSSVSATASTQAPGPWVQRYDGEGERPDFAQSVGVAADGSSVFVTGSSATVAYNAKTGARLWVSTDPTFARSGGSTPPPTLAVSPGSASVAAVFVAGTSGGRGGPAAGSATGPATKDGGGEDIATIALNAATGARLWSTAYDGPAKLGDGARSVAVSPSGGTVFVNGISQGTGTGSDLATIAYSAATGEQLWVSRYNGSGKGDEVYFPGGVQSLAVSPDGSTVFVTVGSPGGTTGADYATIAYNAVTGARRWVTRYNGPANSDDVPTSVGVSRDGATVFVTGSSSGKVNADFATVAYDAATGKQRWASRYNGPADQNEGAIGIGVDPTGAKVVVTGTSEGPTPEKEDVATVAYNAATGAQVWAQRYNGPAGRDDNAAALAMSPDGAKVYVTGRSVAADSSAVLATVTYTMATGAQLSAERYTDPSSGGNNQGNEARSVVVSPSGDMVYVTGTSNDDYVTIAYRG